MNLKNTKERYGGVAKGFHWLVAVIVLGMLPLGYYMTGLDFSPFKLQLYGLHKSFGTLILFLVILRLVWRLGGPVPQSLPQHHKWERRLAHITHYALYAALFLMPLSGWVMSSAGDFPHSFFGLFEMPDLTEKNKAIFDQSRFMHEVLACALIVLVGLHFAGAVKHHIIDRDETLLRMLPGALPRFSAVIAIAAGLTFFIVTALAYIGSALDEAPGRQGAEVLQMKEAAPQEPAALLSAAPENAVPRWQIIPEKSEIGFEVEVQGESFTGTFAAVKGEIYFDPDNLAASSVSVAVKIKSVETGSAERDQYIAMKPWLDAESFPESKYEAEEFEKINENQYVARGHLTMRGMTQAVPFPFTLEYRETEEGKMRAYAEGRMDIKRLAYDIGTGQWSDTEIVGNKVLITVSLVAEKLRNGK